MYVYMCLCIQVYTYRGVYTYRYICIYIDVYVSIYTDMHASQAETAGHTQ